MKYKLPVHRKKNRHICFKIVKKPEFYVKMKRGTQTFVKLSSIVRLVFIRWSARSEIREVVVGKKGVCCSSEL